MIDWLLAQADEPTQSVKDIAKSTGDIPDGMRDNVLTSIAGTLRDAGFGEDAIYEHLYKINEERCQPPKSDADIQRIAHSIAKHEDGIDRRIKETPLLNGVPVGTITAAQSQTASVPVDPKDWRKQFKKVSELPEGDVPWLIKGLLPEGTIFFGALSGHGKTLLGLSLARALTTGRPMFGQFEVPEQIPVLYLIPEFFRPRVQEPGLEIQDSKRREQIPVPHSERWSDSAS